MWAYKTPIGEITNPTWHESKWSFKEEAEQNRATTLKVCRETWPNHPNYRPSQVYKLTDSQVVLEGLHDEFLD